MPQTAPETGRAGMWCAGRGRRLAYQITEVITWLPEPFQETATNTPNSGDQHTERQSLAAAAVLPVQFAPFGLVITRFVPKAATATNKPNSEDQQTDIQSLSAAEVLLVQVTPSGLVITRLPVPVLAIAVNNLNWGD